MHSLLQWVRSSVIFGILALAGGTLLPAPAPAQGADVTVFAAASLKTALDEVLAGWTRETGRRATVSYAASSALARQIEQGAPADIFISADLDWMDYLGARNLIDAPSRLSLLGNRLVLVAARESPAAVTIAPGLPLAAALEDGRLALAGVEAVPAGKYAKAALEALGVWESVRRQTAQAENVRAALALVARGETPLGIVYETDARSDPAVRVVGRFPETAHPPIVYPAALVAGAKGVAAAALLQHLRSPAALAIFEAQGFTPLPAPVTSQ